MAVTLFISRLDRATSYIPSASNQQKISEYTSAMATYRNTIDGLEKKQNVSKVRGFLFQWLAIVLFIAAFVSLIKILKK